MTIQNWIARCRKDHRAWLRQPVVTSADFTPHSVKSVFFLSSRAKITADEVRAIYSSDYPFRRSKFCIWRWLFDIDPKFSWVGNPDFGDLLVVCSCWLTSLAARLSLRGHAGNREYGQSISCHIPLTSSLFNGTPESQLVLYEPCRFGNRNSADFVRTGTAGTTVLAAIENPAKKIYGIQFHPVCHSEFGYDILQLRSGIFVELKVTGLWITSLTWKSIRQTVKNKKVLVGTFCM